MNHTSDPSFHVQVLAVSPHEGDHTALAHIFGHTSWEIESARSLKEAALRLLDSPAPVLLCEEKLPDGTWKDLLALSQSLSNPSFLIVTSQEADDRLWAEVLDSGAYDVLAKPFHSQEVFRSIGLAWRHWIDARKCAGRAFTNKQQTYTAGAAVA